MKNIQQRFEIYTKQFSGGAISWNDATDDIRRFCNMVRVEYNLHVLKASPGDPNYIEEIDHKTLLKPSTWNTKYKLRINKLWPSLSPQSKTKILDCFI